MQLPSRARFRVLISGLLVGASCLAGPGLSSASASTARVGSAPVTPAGAQVEGSLPSSTPLQVTVALTPQAGLAQYASEVSDPDSFLYHQYLSVAQFRQQFAPSDSQIAQVESALKAEGLNPGAVSANGLSIPVSATAGQLSSAFSTDFQQVKVGNRSAFRNTAAPQFSSNVAGLVQGVLGLNSLALPTPVGNMKKIAHGSVRDHAQPATSGPTACSGASGTGEYTATQIASAYQFSSLYSAGDEGAGQTVALYELEPNLTTDISAYQSCYGTSASVTYTKVDGGSGTGAGEGEAALDIEQIIGLAPKANIIVYQGPNSDSGAYDTYNSIISADKAKVISTSWGLCESSEGSSAASEENTLFEEAATQGQSIFAAAGDSGAEDCGTSALAVDDPASQPYVTGVGGTSMSKLGPPPTQSVWNDECQSSKCGGGGGISTLWTMPSYQSGAPSSLGVINSLSSGTPCKAASGSYCREVPDVTADADPATGYSIYYDGSWGGIGGTSAAAPLWAAFTALANASTACNGTNIGFANPALYKAGASAYSSDFNDISSGNNNLDGGTSFPATTGYDMASGLGSPIGPALASTLCGGGGTTTPTVTVTNPGSQSGTVGTAASLQISATDSDGGALSYTASGLPTGLSISSSTGLISGTPTTAGTYSVTVTATDASGPSGTASFSWTESSAASPTVTVTNPGSQSGTVGTAASLAIKATDSDGGTLTYSATGLPTGLSISSSTGAISGTPTTAGSYSVAVTAKDASGPTGTATFTWTIAAKSSCTASQLLGNPNFTTGSASPWTTTSGVVTPTSDGEASYNNLSKYVAWLDGYGTKHTDTLAQTVTIPSGCTNYAFSFYLHVDTSNTSTKAQDTLTVQVLSGSTVLGTLGTFSNLNAASGYVAHSYSLAAYAGKSVTLKFTGVENETSSSTSFVVSDTGLNVS